MCYSSNSVTYLCKWGRQPLVETAKEVFFIGSVLGILAFLNTLIHPAFADNRQKWEALKERLTEEDLIDLQYEVYVSRKVRDELLYKVRRVVHDIEQDAESVRFGPRFRGLFRQHKDDLSSDFRCLYKRV